MSKRMIARELGLHHSIVCREIKRNSVRGKYKPEAANKKAKKRMQTARAVPRRLHGTLLNRVVECLQEEWSPQQISGRLRQEGLRISHEAIYQMVWQDKADGGSLYLHLRHCGKKYNKRAGKTSGRGLIPHRVDIAERPAIVETKTRVGDWEADTVIGADHKGALVTLVERATKMTLIQKVATTSKELVTKAILNMLHGLKNTVHTLTFDNGKEFADHVKIAEMLEARTYFAKPYHSWERGLNEHTNGLIRQYLPKGTNFLQVSHKKVALVQKKINTRPRNVLLFKTPNEVFYSSQSVAWTG
jgi:IS30 family transposase